MAILLYATRIYLSDATAERKQADAKFEERRCYQGKPLLLFLRQLSNLLQLILLRLLETGVYWELANTQFILCTIATFS